MALTPYSGEEVDSPKLTPYDGPEAQPPAAPSRLRRFVADPAISAVKGVIGVPEAAVGLADIMTGGRAGKAAEAVGFRPKEAKAILDTLYSPEQQAANQTVADAEGFLPTAGAMLRNPSTIAHAVIESAPSVLGGAGVARGLVKAGVPIAAAAGLGEGAVSAGSTAEQIRQESETGLLTGRQAGIAGVSGLATAGLGAAGNRLARRFGIADVDALLAGTDDAVKMHPAKALAAGAVTEGVFEELSQSAQEQAAQNYATGKPVTEGVAKAAASGALAGGVMGGGVASVKSLLAKHIGTSKVNEHIQSIPDMPPEEQRPAVAELAAAVHPENPVAAVEFQAEVLDRLDAGEPVVDTTPELAAPTKETLVEALQEAVASGGEINPVEVLQGKEETQVLEALRKERPMPAEPVVEVPPTAQVRAERWLKEGGTLTREGMTPDPEVAALLDDMGYTLTQGERADRTQGGSIARREWLVEKKPHDSTSVRRLQADVERTRAEQAKRERLLQNPSELEAYAQEKGISALEMQELLAANYQSNQTHLAELETEFARPEVQAILQKKPKSNIVFTEVMDADFDPDSATPLNHPEVGMKPASQAASVKMMITKDETQQLYDLGYKKSQVAKMKPDEAAAILQAGTKPPAAPIQHKEQRQAYPDNPNLKVARENDAILIYDDAAFTRAKDLKDTLGMKASILGMAKIKDGKFDGWVEGREPGALEERVQLERVLRGHLGEVRFSRKTPPVLYRGDSTHEDGLGDGSLGDLGKGLYFTDSAATAEYFTDGSDKSHTRRFKAMLGNTFDLMDRNLHKTTGWKSMLETLPPDPPYGVRPRANLKDWAAGKLDVRNAYNFLAGSFGQTPETFNDFLAAHGFDSVSDQGVRGVSEGDKQYVVFNKDLVARFRRSSGTGLPAAEISQHLAPVLEKLKVPVQVVATAEEIPGLDTDVKFTGVFLNGKIYLNAANLTSKEEAESVLLQHEIRHAGLRSIFDRKGLDALLAKTWGDLNSGVSAFAKDRGIDTRSREGKLEAAEEYIVELAKTEDQSPVWDRFVALFKALLRRVGFNLKLSDTELRWLVARSGEVIVEGALPGETGSRFAAAWHGTPHKFDKFSLSKIGTGEGAQAYGYGLYFAGSKAVAEYYKEALSGRPAYKYEDQVFAGNLHDPYYAAINKVVKNGKADAVGYFETQIKYEENPEAKSVFQRQLDFVRGLDETKIETVQNTGSLYQVELAPEEDEYLLWDRPLSEQSEKVKGALKVAGFDAEWEEKRAHRGARGEDIYSHLADEPGGSRRMGLAPEENSPEKASAYLHSLGIRGIKYLDGVSRNNVKISYKGVAYTYDHVKATPIMTALVEDGFDMADVHEALAYVDGMGTVDLAKKSIRLDVDAGLPQADADRLLAVLDALREDANYNYVIFNDEDVEIKARFARLSPKEAINEVASRTELTIAKRVLSDVSGNVWRSIMPVDRTIKLAQSIPLYAPIKNLLGDYLIHKRAKAAATDAHATRAQKNREAHEEVFTSDADTKAFNALTAKATLYELHADGRNAGWTDASWEKAGKLKQTGKTLGAARSEIAELWAKLSPEQQKVQQKIIDHMKVIADEHREALLEPLRLSFGEEMFDQADAVAAQILTLDDKGRAALQTSTPPNVHSLALQIAQIKAERTLKGDYAPLTRFGDHIVRTFKDGKRIKTQIFESKKAADDAIAAIKATPGVYPEYELKPEGERGVTNIPLAFLEQLKMAAEARGITGESLDTLMDDFKAARLQTMPRATIAGNSLHREGIEGYSEDMLRSYAAYASRSGRAIANLKYGTLIEQTFRDMGNAIKAYQDPDGEWSPHAVERMSTLKENLYRLERQANIEKINALTKLLGKATFLWYLSSPSVWAVQWSQPFMTTIPKMAARYGFTKAFGAYTSEVKQYLSGAFSDEKIDAFNTLHENAGERLFALIQEERRALPHEKKGIRSAMQALYNGFDEKGKKLLILKVLGLQGMLDLSSSHALQDLIAGASAGDKLMDKVVSKGAFFMQKSETGSRRAAAVSAFQLALDNGRDIMEANDYAANIIDDTLADFSSQNRPGLMRGNVGRIIGQFQFFRLHMLGKVVQLFKDAYGEKGWGENRKELSYMVGMSMALAGAGGTPIALAFSNSATSLIFSALAMAFGDPDDPWDPEQEFYAAVREAMGDTAGNAFLMGLPSLFGMDVSKRIGMGGFADVLSGEPPPGLSGTQRAQWYASRMLGPSFGLFSDSMRAFDALADGDLGEAMAVSSPKVVKDFIKTTQLSEKGITGIGGKTVTQPDEVSPVSLALQLVGINPAEVALAQQERREVAALSTTLRERRSLLTKRVTEATLDGDFEAREEALGAINEWGAKQPALMITQKELLAAVKKGMRMRAGMLSEKEIMLQEKVRGL